MRSLEHATQLIEASNTIPGMLELLAELGFSEPLPLDDAALTTLGIRDSITTASVAKSIGSLRALVIVLPSAIEPRVALRLVARSLSATVPHITWLLVATQTDSPLLAVATWTNGSGAPYLLALITARDASVDSDAETLCALSACSACEPDALRRLRWNDILGRKSITLRFFRALERSVLNLAASLERVPAEDAARLALLTTSRLLFLSFLETKGWMNGDFAFLANGFADCMAAGGRYHTRILDPLFFGTLNTPTASRALRALAFGRIPFLNGGLFSRSRAERLHGRARFSDDALGALYGDVLTRYRFTAREDARTWSETAVDPEMLGKAFEALMSRTDRKRDGVFYTPNDLVERLVQSTLDDWITTRIGTIDLAEARSGHGVPHPLRSALLSAIARIRLLDPACGSGAFLVRALESLADLRLGAGDLRTTADIRRDVLTRSIHGVDVNPTAVWLCQLRLWLSVVVESDERDPAHVIPLPNLDRQIRVGDSLGGAGFGPSVVAPHARALGASRRRYARATGARKRSLARTLDQRERRCAIALADREIERNRAERREIVSAARSPDLFRARIGMPAHARLRVRELRDLARELRVARTRLERGELLPFAYEAHFADIAATGGFDMIVGNPPWVRPHKLAKSARDRYRETFTTARNASWTSGADDSHAGSGFAAQFDLAALFVERSLGLLAFDGVAGLLLPSKLWRSLSGGGVRRLVQERMHLLRIEDVAADGDAFDAATYPSLLVARRPPSVAVSRPSVTIKRAADQVWTAQSCELAFDTTPGSPWLLLPNDVRQAFDHLATIGVPIARSIFGRPRLGVKTGCNDAFVVSRTSTSDDAACVTSGDRVGVVEPSMLRPLLRGETIRRWRIVPNDEYLIWTHDERGRPRRTLPPLALDWLQQWRRALERRADARGSRWWTLFRTDGAACDSPRVVWSDFGREPRAAVIPCGDRTVPINTCYAVHAPSHEDAAALTAVLNSHLASAWLGPLAEPARGGYRRYLGWTMSRFPLPAEWARVRDSLASVAQRAADGNATDGELLACVCRAYGVSDNEMRPLLEWPHA